MQTQIVNQPFTLLCNFMKSSWSVDRQPGSTPGMWSCRRCRSASLLDLATGRPRSQVTVTVIARSSQPKVPLAYLTAISEGLGNHSADGVVSVLAIVVAALRCRLGSPAWRRA